MNWKDWEAGFLTDQRSFSNIVTASRRMQSLVEFNLGSSVTILRTSHTSSGTTEVNILTGAQLGHAVADMSRCRFSALVRHQPPAGIARGQTQGRVPFGGSFTLNHPTSAPPPHPSYKTRLVAMAGDPLVSAAADIDYVGEFELVVNPANPASCTITFEGKIDDFPAYECYAKLGQVTKTLFTSSPPAGHTVTNLLGPANRPIRGIASF